MVKRSLQSGPVRAIRVAVMAFFMGAMLTACSQEPDYGPDKPLTDRPQALARTETVYAQPSDRLMTTLSYYSCDNCHAIDHQRLGPALADVAQVYADSDDEARTALADRIANGSTGRWGTMTMPRQPAIDSATARQLADDILALHRDDSNTSTRN